MKHKTSSYNLSTQIDRYDEMYKNFKWKVPEFYNFGFDVVDKWAEDRTKLALISIDRTSKRDRYHTFRDLSVESNRFANALRRIGIKKGDRVLVILQSINRKEHSFPTCDINCHANIIVKSTNVLL